jgi:DNA repair protein RadC
VPVFGYGAILPDMRREYMNTTEIREVRLNYGPAVTGPIVNQPRVIVDFLREIAPNNSQEHVIAVYLDGKHAPIGYSVISTGLATSCPVHPREVFQRAVCLGACAVVMAHNHPSGSVKWSPEDAEVTKKIKDAGVVLGIKLLDHIIFTDTEFYSFMEDGRL